MSVGASVRTALIGCLHQRGLYLTPVARATHTPAALLNHLSTDITRIDYLAQWFHPLWGGPLQIILCLIIMAIQLGPSTLVGFTVFILVIPIQQVAMSFQFRQRKASMIWTDKRAKMFQEVFGAMKVIKYLSAENYYLKRIADIREQELIRLCKILVARSAKYVLSPLT
jgi:ABC-type multidrug transport system fused ATPase/permease subunit